MNDSISSIKSHNISGDCSWSYIPCSMQGLTQYVDTLGYINNEKKLEGENIMEKILNIYEDKKINEIKEKYTKQRENIIDKDELEKFRTEMEEQLKILLEKNEMDIKGSNVIISGNKYSPETKKILEELNENYKKETENVDKKISEIKALLELAPTYENKIQILRDYEIMDKKKNIIL